MIGSQVQVVALNDGTPAGDAAGVLYQPTVDLVLREIEPAFSRRTAALASAGGSLIDPWAFKYTYPSDCIRLRQVRPATGSYTVNDPEPVRASVVFDVIAAVNVKVIVTNQAGALAVYTSNLQIVDRWDAAFAEVVARRLASPLALALAGRPDFSRELLDEADKYAQMSDAMDEV